MHAPADGAWNMAVDEAILETYTRSGQALSPTLRLYAWQPAALSLGRRQAAADCHDPCFLRQQGIDLVRRPSGGRAVLHQAERTYAVTGCLRVEPFTGGVVETYARVAQALATALGELGLGVSQAPLVRVARREGASIPDGGACFAAVSAHELTVRGRKLVGSAQIRRRGAFLQHGSIPLECTTRQLERALGTRRPITGLTDLRQELGDTVDLDLLDQALIGAFGSCFGARLDRGDLSLEEAQRAEQLRCWKYSSAAWTLAGQLGLRERCWGPALG